LKQVASTLWFVGIIALIIGVIIAYLFATMISRPIKNMTAAGNKIADGDLNAEIPDAKTGDEIEDLGTTMKLLVGAIKFLKGEKGEKPAVEKKAKKK
jgi:nitrogen fixation/metabolism regulation signal transduction histidine kinase